MLAAIRRASSRINTVGPALARFFGVPPVTALSCEYDLFIRARIDGRISGEGAVDNEVTNEAVADEKILTFDVPDEALERAASAEQTGTTAGGHSSVPAL
jgi:hypothetical protein